MNTRSNFVIDSPSDFHKSVSAATQAAIGLKANAAAAASNIELQTPLLWYFDPPNPTATRRISFDLTGIAPLLKQTPHSDGNTKTMINLFNVD